MVYYKNIYYFFIILISWLENLTSGNIVAASETAKVPAESTTINRNYITEAMDIKH